MTQSGLVKVTDATSGDGRAVGDNSTICALRQVTTDPLPRGTMGSNLLPSSLSMARTRTG
ncbi:hypothetical protein ACI782_07955 [Geodermatophilus sp. SYSU D00703]